MFLIDSVLAPWLEYVIPQHLNTLESLDLELVDHNEKQILENVLTNFFNSQCCLRHLAVTAFLTRDFADTVMTLVENGTLALETLFIKAYSFECDIDFIRKLLKKFYCSKNFFRFLAPTKFSMFFLLGRNERKNQKNIKF